MTGSAPDELNAELRLTVVATGLDSGSERIVNYLREFEVPINVVFFAFLEDEGRKYLTRSWLAAGEDNTAGAHSTLPSRKGKRAAWNQRDWFVSFGEYEGGRSWKDGRRFGFVSAGGGPWFSKTLKSVPVGARVNVHIPKLGYVAVGITLAQAQRFDEAKVSINGDWVPLASRDLEGTYRSSITTCDLDEDAEYVIPVRWLVAVPSSDAYWEKGMFANQNSACKLRQEFTLDHLRQHFSLDEHDDDL